MNDVEKTQTPEIPVLSKPQQDLYVSYLATGGVMTGDDMKVTTMTKKEFADKIGVHVNTLDYWKKTIPNLGQRIRQRRDEIFPVARETALWNRLYIIAMTGKGQPAVEAAKIYLGHAGGLQLPVQRQDVKVQGSLAEVLSSAEKTVLEGEVVDELDKQEEYLRSQERLDNGA